jgi:hypothetical protein
MTPKVSGEILDVMSMILDVSGEVFVMMLGHGVDVPVEDANILAGRSSCEALPRRRNCLVKLKDRRERRECHHRRLDPVATRPQCFGDS